MTTRTGYRTLLTSGCILALLLVPAPAMILLLSPSEKQEADQYVVIDPDTLDLGPVWQTEQITHSIALKNVSQVPVQATVVADSCRVQGSTQRHLTLEPGSTESVSFTFRLYTPAAELATEEQVPLLENLVLSVVPQGHTRPAATRVMPLVGTVKNPYFVPHSAYFVGKHAIRQGFEPQPMILPMETNVPLESVSADCAVADVKVRRLDLHRWQLAITPRLDEQPGKHFEGEIELTAVAAGGIQLALRTLRIAGEVIPPYFSLPDPILLAPAQAAASDAHRLQAQFRVISSCSQPFRIVSVQAPEGFAVQYDPEQLACVHSLLATAEAPRPRSPAPEADIVQLQIAPEGSEELRTVSLELY